MNILSLLFEIKIVRYLVSGGVATLVNLAVLYAFTDLVGLHYLISAVISFLCALGVSFVMQKRWTFKDHSTENTHVKFAVFTVVACLNLGLNTLILYFFTDILGVYYLISQMIASAVIAVWSYLVYGKVFKKKTS